MTGMNIATDMKVMTITTTIELARPVRHGGRSLRRSAAVLLVAWSLLLTPSIAAHAAEDAPHESAISAHAKSFGAAVKRDTKAVSAKCKEGAHRVAVAAKAVGHEIGTAAKRGAAATRAAFRGEKAETPAS
jgi:hypothetical protein